LAGILSPKIAGSTLKLNLLTNFRSYVGKYFSNHKLRALMEFPVIFLGASPTKIPALYSLMNYGGYALGTLVSDGRFLSIGSCYAKVAAEQGAYFHFNQNIDQIIVEQGQAKGLIVNGEFLAFDSIIASCDYHHTETLLEPNMRNYDEKYWASRTFAPSCLIYYLGFNERIPNLKHHTLFFEKRSGRTCCHHLQHQKMAGKPLFYACCPSKTDPSVAPEGVKTFINTSCHWAFRCGIDSGEVFIRNVGTYRKTYRNEEPEVKIRL
jgi:phytoene desaturase